VAESQPQVQSLHPRLLQPIFLAYLLVILMIGHRTWKTPAWTWDLLAYLGCVAEVQGQASGTIHGRAYGELERVAPPHVVSEFRSGEVTERGQQDYREELAANPAAFEAQLSFYRGRTLFIHLLVWLEKLGLPSIQGAFLISILAGVSFSLLLAAWLNHYLSPSLAVIVALATLELSGIGGVASMGGPDMLAATLLFSGSYLLLETQRPWVGTLLLLAALATRADHLLLIAPLVLYVSLVAPDGKAKLGVGPAALILALCLGTAAWCTIGQDAYSWWTVFHHTFVQYLFFPGEQAPLPDYGLAVNHSLRSLPMFKAPQPLIFSLLAGAGVLWGWRKQGARSFGAGLAGASLLGALGHFALFPALWPRLMLAYWVLGVVGLCAVWNERKASQPH
jgi:hypothetical protein